MSVLVPSPSSHTPSRFLLLPQFPPFFVLTTENALWSIPLPFLGRPAFPPTQLAACLVLLSAAEDTLGGSGEMGVAGSSVNFVGLAKELTGGGGDVYGLCVEYPRGGISSTPRVGMDVLPPFGVRRVLPLCVVEMRGWMVEGLGVRFVLGESLVVSSLGEFWLAELSLAEDEGVGS